MFRLFFRSAKLVNVIELEGKNHVVSGLTQEMRFENAVDVEICGKAFFL